MTNNSMLLLEIAVSFLPFILFAFLNGKANVKKQNRHRQYAMPVIAVIYSVVLLLFLDGISDMLLGLIYKLIDLVERFRIPFVGSFIRGIVERWGIYLMLVLFNTAALLAYVVFKRILTAIFAKVKVRRHTFPGKVVELFYSYDEQEDRWYIKEHFGQARTFIKSAYYASCIISGVTLLISCFLCMQRLVSEPFYPVFAVIIIGEMAFFIDGLEAEETKAELTMEADKSSRVAMYPLLRKPLRALFGDKLSAEGTTVNNGAGNGGGIEAVLANLSQNGGHIGKNYAGFIRKKMEGGLKPNVDYVRSGYDLATGKSLLFNTPFYDKLNPYVFYAINRELLTGGKVLVVLGRHGTEEDLRQWCESGMQAVSNVPDLWKIRVLNGGKVNEDDLPDIGIISRSGVHDLDIHKNNLPFLRGVSFVVVIEPSKLVTTAQVGLNLLIKCCGRDREMTFCSVDRNCDGLVDALSHILMTNITEVSATEYPHGMSSYMYWTADDDYLQHRILPGVSRYLGMGTELSMVALKNQVNKTIWYGGEAYPVLDAHWIAKQYYYDLLDYAKLPTTQEAFDKHFQTSFNMCNERVNDYSFITVEDDRNNLFETRRNFATIAEKQGFVNVISSEYMLREYMSENTELFMADAKAIPYVTADYARTKRNAILSLCLLLCIDSVREEVLHRQMVMLNVNTQEPIAEIWKEVCVIFGQVDGVDKKGIPILSTKSRDGRTVRFERDETILYKRAYSVETGKFESVYTIENTDFSNIILDDLQNASYIAEQESKDVYIGTELKGHVYQKYMPGQFFTLNGKYYEMVSTATDNRILVRRASEHIGGRLSYRQVRNYRIHHLEDASSMGALKSVNNIDIHYQYADFSVETPGYWRMGAHNDFDNGDLVKVNGVPVRQYHHKQILKFGFSKLGDAFTDSVRMTLTNLLNEVFATLFAENQPFISAVTPGQYDAPLTYSLAMDEEAADADKSIYIIEDSQLDIGLLVAVERNVNRILQIIADYLAWNDEQIEESLRKENEPPKETVPFDVYEEPPAPPKKGLFGRIKDFFTRKKNKTPLQDYMMIYGKPHKLVKGDWVPCTQEEFDAKMAGRHQKLAENKKAEKEERARARAEAKAAKKSAKEEAKAAKKAAKNGTAEQAPEDPAEEADQETATVEASEEVTEEATVASEEGAEEELSEQPAEDETVEPEEDAPSVEEKAPEEAPAKLGWFARRKTAKAEKKAAKEAKKAEKAKLKAEKTAATAQNLPENTEEPTEEVGDIPEQDALNEEAEVQELDDQAAQEVPEAEPVEEQPDGEVSEDA